jgi:hypothetical protein
MLIGLSCKKEQEVKPLETTAKFRVIVVAHNVKSFCFGNKGNATTCLCDPIKPDSKKNIYVDTVFYLSPGHTICSNLESVDMPEISLPIMYIYKGDSLVKTLEKSNWNFGFIY